MRHFIFSLFVFCVLAFSVSAHADTISFSSASPDLSPSADTLNLQAGTESFAAVGDVVSQIGSYAADFSGRLVAHIPFTFNESVNVNGVTQILKFTGFEDVTQVSNRIVIDPLGLVKFGTVLLDFSGTSNTITDVSPQSIALSATVSSLSAVPEPSSLALCGTGILVLAGLAKRKMRSA